MEPPPDPPLSTEAPSSRLEDFFLVLAEDFFLVLAEDFFFESPVEVSSLYPVEPLPVEPLSDEGVLVLGTVEPGLLVSAGAVLSEPSGTMPGLSPELAVGSA